MEYRWCGNESKPTLEVPKLDYVKGFAGIQLAKPVDKHHISILHSGKSEGHCLQYWAHDNLSTITT